MKKLTLSLFQKSLLTIIFILLPAIVTTFIYTYNKNKEYLNKDIENDLIVVAEAFEGQVYQFLELYKQRTLDFSTDFYIRDTLHKIINGNKSLTKNLSEYLIKVKMPLDKPIHEIYVISSDGRIAGSPNPSEIGEDMSNNEDFKNGINGLSISDNISGHEGIPEITVSSPIIDINSGKPIGVLMNFIQISELGNILSGEYIKKLGKMSYIKPKKKTLEVYLVNRDRLMITNSISSEDSIFEQRVDTIPVQRCMESNKEFSGSYKGYKGGEVIGVSMCMPTVKWALITELDFNEAMIPMEEMKNNILKSAATIIGLIGVVFIIFLKKIVLQLRRISSASKEIAEGNYNITLPVKTSDEIGTLSDSFNKMVIDIRDRTRLLQDSEGTLRAIIDNSTNVFYLKDAEGRYILINKKYEELFKITKEKINGKTDFDVFPKDFASKFRENDIKVLESKNPLEFEEIVPQDDGVHHYISVKFPIYDPHGNIYAVCGISTDMTKRKRAEREANLLQNISLFISESKDFHSSLKVSLSKICEITGWLFGEVWLPLPDKTALEFSNIWCGKWEYGGKFAELSNEFMFPPGIGLPGRVWLSKKPEWIRDVSSENSSVFPRIDIAKKMGLKAGFAIPIIANDEVLAVIEFFMGEMMEEDKRMIEIISAVSAQLGNVFLRKLSDDARHKVQQRFERLVNTLNVIIFRTKEDCSIIDVNQAGIVLFEANSKAELLRHTWKDFFKDKDIHKKLLDNLFKNGFIKDEEIELVSTKGNMFWGSISAIVTTGEDSNLYIDGILEDINSRKKLEGQLMHAQKMEAVGQLAGGIAHDFNNTLTAIMGFGNLLLMKRREDELIKNFAGQIIEAARKSTDMVRNLLTFGRKHTLNPQPADLNDIVRTSEKILKRLISEDIELKTILKEESLISKVDSV